MKAKEESPWGGKKTEQQTCNRGHLPGIHKNPHGHQGDRAPRRRARLIPIRHHPPPQDLLLHGIHILGTVGIDLLQQIRIVATSKQPLEIIYEFTSHNKPHHRKISITPATSRKWKAQGTTVEIIQHIFTSNPTVPADLAAPDVRVMPKLKPTPANLPEFIAVLNSI